MIGGNFTAGVTRLRRAPAVTFWCVSIALGLVVFSGCDRRAPESDIRLDGVAPEVAAAVVTAQSAVMADPASAAGWLKLGMTCEANGLSADARRAYEQATSLNSRDARSWYRLAVVRARSGQPVEALAALDHAIALDGTYAPAHWRRGLWLLDASRPDDAHSSFEKAAALDAASPGGWIGLARVALLRKKEAEAVEVLEGYLSQHPGDRYALRLLGTAYQRLGRTEEAAYALSVGATGEPVWPDPWTDEVSGFRVGFSQTLKAATAQVLAGQFAAAVPVLEQLLRERPDEISLMHQLGLSYVAAGRAPEGVALLERALAQDGGNLESHLRLATAYLNLQDFPRSLKHAERAIALSPELGRAHEAAGLALWRSARPADALNAFERAARFEPTNLGPMVWAGWILLESGRVDEAMEQFSRAVRKNPIMADAVIGMGLVHLRRRQFDEAEAALERAARLEPANPRLGPARAQFDAARAVRR